MKIILFSGIFVYLGIGFFLYLEQRNFIYFPTHSSRNDLPEHSFQHDGHTIKANVLNPGNKNAIIYFGGNAENVEFNADDFSVLFPNHTVFLVKYRGYGGSTGSPTETGIYADALHIHDELSNTFDSISVVGRSLGSAVATYVASKREIKKLVLITPFDSIQRVAQSQFPLYPIGILLKDKHDSYSRAKTIKADTMIIAAEQDSIIKMPRTVRLIEGFNTEVSFRIIAGVGHNDISRNPDYYKELGTFLR